MNNSKTSSNSLISFDDIPLLSFDIVISNIDQKISLGIDQIIKPQLLTLFQSLIAYDPILFSIRWFSINCCSITHTTPTVCERFSFLSLRISLTLSPKTDAHSINMLTVWGHANFHFLEKPCNFPIAMKISNLARNQPPLYAKNWCKQNTVSFRECIT